MVFMMTSVVVGEGRKSDVRVGDSISLVKMGKWLTFVAKCHGLRPYTPVHDVTGERKPLCRRRTALHIDEPPRSGDPQSGHYVRIAKRVEARKGRFCACTYTKRR